MLAILGVLLIHRACTLEVVGKGGTLPQTVYEDAATLYSFVRPDITITYQGVGSGAAKTAIAQGDVVFACSDSGISNAMYAATPDLQMVTDHTDCLNVARVSNSAPRSSRRSPRRSSRSTTFPS